MWIRSGPGGPVEGVRWGVSGTVSLALGAGRMGQVGSGRGLVIKGVDGLWKGPGRAVEVS